MMNSWNIGLEILKVKWLPWYLSAPVCSSENTERSFHSRRLLLGIKHEQSHEARRIMSVTYKTYLYQ